MSIRDVLHYLGLAHPRERASGPVRRVQDAANENADAHRRLREAMCTDRSERLMEEVASIIRSADDGDVRPKCAKENKSKQ